MKRSLALLFLSAILSAAQPPTPVIFDTDMGNDVDDALALAMLHSLQSRGEIRLAAVTVTKDNIWAGRFVSAMNTFYKRPGIPIGLVKDGVTKEDGKYLRPALEPGKFKYTDPKLDAVELLRKTLAAEADGSVVIIQVGFSTNLARLLASPGGRELAAKKVKLLALMGGDFAGNGPEYNIKEDIPAAKKLTAEWPTRMVWSGFEIGEKVKFPATSIERDYAWAPAHPAVDAYKAYMKFPYDRETWDLTAVLYAVRPDSGYFTLSAPGNITVDDKGFTHFAVSSSGKSSYLLMNDTQRARTLEALIWLSTEPVR